MNITYQLSEEEYQQAVNLHHKKGKRLLMLSIYVMLATIIVIFGTDFSNTREIITNIIAAFFSISFYMLFVRMLSVYQAKSVYQKSTTLPYEITLHISGKGIRLDKNSNNISIPWKAFSKWKNDEHFYLLYTNPRRFNVIPTRAMSETQKKEFDAYLEKYIPQG
ncbi:MAG: YcxB family protein [Sulfurovum sp.]